MASPVPDPNTVPTPPPAPPTPPTTGETPPESGLVKAIEDFSYWIEKPRVRAVSAICVLLITATIVYFLETSSSTNVLILTGAGLIVAILLVLPFILSDGKGKTETPTPEPAAPPTPTKKEAPPKTADPQSAKAAPVAAKATPPAATTAPVQKNTNNTADQKPETTVKKESHVTAPATSPVAATPQVTRVINESPKKKGNSLSWLIIGCGIIGTVAFLGITVVTLMTNPLGVSGLVRFIPITALFVAVIIYEVFAAGASKKKDANATEEQKTEQRWWFHRRLRRGVHVATATFTLYILFLFCSMFDTPSLFTIISGRDGWALVAVLIACFGIAAVVRYEGEEGEERTGNTTNRAGSAKPLGRGLPSWLAIGIGSAFGVFFLCLIVYHTYTLWAYPNGRPTAVTPDEVASTATKPSGSLADANKGKGRDATAEHTRRVLGRHSLAGATNLTDTKKDKESQGKPDPKNQTDQSAGQKDQVAEKKLDADANAPAPPAAKQDDSGRVQRISAGEKDNKGPIAIAAPITNVNLYGGGWQTAPGVEKSSAPTADSKPATKKGYRKIIDLSKKVPDPTKGDPSIHAGWETIQSGETVLYQFPPDKTNVRIRSGDPMRPFQIRVPGQKWLTIQEKLADGSPAPTPRQLGLTDITLLEARPMPDDEEPLFLNVSVVGPRG